MKIKPLEGVRILSVEQYGAGPFATMQLADLGAEVIKIEDPGTNGDVSRSVIPYAQNGDSLFFQSFNRNKKSITLNLKSAEGKEMFHELVKHSDAVFNNLRGDVVARLGIDYEALQHINPRIVTCSLSGYGTKGSMMSEPAYDYLLQGMAGHMSLTGEPGSPPTKYGLSLIDLSTGMMAAIGLMTGIFQARDKGIGCAVDVSLFDTALSELAYLATWHLNQGYRPERTAHSAHPTLVPSQLFPTKDGHVVVMCNKEKFFPALCEAIGAKHLAEDPRYSSFALRYQNKDPLIASLTEIFSKENSAHWLTQLKGKAPIAPVHTVEEALQEPFVLEREMIVDVEHDQFGPLKMIATPIKMSNYKPDYEAAPVLGKHNEEIYGKLLGLAKEDLKVYQSKSII